jgi:hypothetical protein
MRLQRDTWLAIGLLLALVVVTILIGIWEAERAEKPPYSSYSSQPDGALALREWMDGMGYNILPIQLSAFEPPAEADLIIMLEPVGVLWDEIESLYGWVYDGNTLLLAGNGLDMRQMARSYDVQVQWSSPRVEQAMAQNPLLSQPPLAGAVTLDTAYILSPQRSDYVAHLGADGQPVLVSFPIGEGRVILSSAPSLFSNQGLKQTNAPEAVLNVLRLGGEPGTVWFNEWHHGERGGFVGEIIGPSQWLRRTPIGRALLLMAAIVFLGILLQGRLFGRPVPPAREIRRRTPLEYVRAIANLGRRAGHRQHVMLQYYTTLKRRLGKRYRIDPSLPDAEYVEVLGSYNPNLDQPALLTLLTHLQKKRPGESEMVKLAAEAAEWLKETP